MTNNSNKTKILCGKKFCWWNLDNICNKKFISINHETAQCMDFVERQGKTLGEQEEDRKNYFKNNFFWALFEMRKKEN